MSKILLVEDDFAISLLYKTKLEIHDWLVDVAHNGLEALKQVEKNSYDIILLDLKMPYMDGEEFLRRFRKEQQDENNIGKRGRGYPCCPCVCPLLLKFFYHSLVI